MDQDVRLLIIGMDQGVRLPCRRWWAGTVAWPPNVPVSTVKRCACLGHRRSSLRVHLSSPLHPSVRAYSERERRAGGVLGGTNLPSPISRSQSSTSMNDARPWKLCTPPGMCAVCGDVMYVCHFYVGRTTITITRNVRPLILRH